MFPPLFVTFLDGVETCLSFHHQRMSNGFVHAVVRKLLFDTTRLISSEVFDQSEPQCHESRHILDATNLHETTFQGVVKRLD